jgi:hypothetical protein
VCFLVDDNWDDFGYKTLFHLIYLDRQGLRRELGDLKITQRGMGLGRVAVKENFRKLDKSYASLGSDQKFYENVVALGPDTAREVFESLRDAAWDPGIRDRFREDAAFITSLMRGLRNVDVRKFGDIAHGRATLTPYRFEYTFPNSEGRTSFSSHASRFTTHEYTCNHRTEWSRKDLVNQVIDIAFV